MCSHGSLRSENRMLLKGELPLGDRSCSIVLGRHLPVSGEFGMQSA